MTSSRRIASSIAALSACAAPAFASPTSEAPLVAGQPMNVALATRDDDASSPAPPSSSSTQHEVIEDGAFHFTVSLDAWFPRLVGNAPLGPGNSSIDIDALDLHGSEVAFFGSARLSWDRWHVEARGFNFDTDGTSPTQPGIASASASWWSASVDVGYAMWRPFDDRPCQWSSPPSPEHPSNNLATDGCQRLGLALGPTLCVAWDQVDVDTVATGGGRNGVNGGWGSVRFGFEAVLDLHTKDLLTVIDSVEIFGQGSVGPTFGVEGDGDGVGVVWWIDAGMRAYFTPNIAAHLGYRLIDAHFADDDPTDRDSLDVGLQGLFAGVTIRF